MKSFVFNVPTKILFGAGQLGNLHEEKLPGKKALIITSNGKSVKENGALARTEAELDKAGAAYALFDEIRPNPTHKNVMDGAAAVKNNGCDFVIALGGGSVMDCAKCIALMAANSGDIWDYSLSAKGGKKTPANPAIPIVCITTSAGTGSEVDSASVISDDEAEEKTGIFFPSMFPVLSIVDPDLMMSVPANFTAYQGMDAFFHASESVINKNEHVMGEMLALKAIELIAKYLPRAVKDGSDKEARYYMAAANTLAGYYMLCTSAHTMEHSMGSYHENLVHGAGLIMIAHEYYDFFAERKAAEEQMIKMAKAMGAENASSGKDFVAALDKLIADISCADLKMSDAGITRGELAKYPAHINEVMGGDITADPLSDADYLGMFEHSYR
ncbi:MAG: iron-containing alcohol dehydrogenase [Lachnospiraceae bacterium]|nr:iron-containing alcohol dehydrogenase [Ruminococcus sp.]MCM1276355.1 iron-containing alcohol dehydrogenase [Lachnospiraceae bacterium]